MPKPKPNRYAKLSTEDFDRILIDLVNDTSSETLITIPGIYELLAEYFNNDVLDAWDHEQGRG